VKLFFEKIDIWNEADDKSALEKELWETYGCDRAVLVADLCGFSRSTKTDGIVSILGGIRRMQLAAEPVIRQWRGELVKFFADDILAVFESPFDAVEAAKAFRSTCHAMNLTTPDQRDIHLSSGISFGKILYIQGQDAFGDPVNLASKMGEDMGEKDEILIDESVRAHLPSDCKEGLLAHAKSSDGFAVWSVF